MTDPHDSAYPVPAVTTPNGDVVWGSNGLTKRERFALAAMQGLCANLASVDWGERSIAKMAWKQADVMLAVENKQ